MKYAVPVLFTLFTLSSCSSNTQTTQAMQHQIDSLEQVMSKSYKPGFGEFMTYVQAHHQKLWFAGQHQNWKLADFELNEIKETMGKIQQFETDRKESKLVPMILPALDSVSAAIQKKDAKKFNHSFTVLTNTCNQCHTAAQYPFNVVKVPDKNSFPNQDFRVQ